MMKKKILSAAILLVILLMAVAPFTYAEGESELITITAFDGTTFDGTTFDGKLRMPKEDTVSALIVYVNGSGPNTYDNKRQYEDKTFNHFDLFAEQSVERGIAFFSYNTRGVTPGDEPPYFREIDDLLYQTYLPQNEAKDIEAIIKTLKQKPGLEDAKVYLLGWSAGAMIAPVVAQSADVQVDGLLLGGYPNDTMEETLMWQQTGGNLMLLLREYFEADADGNITKEAYEADPYGVGGSFGAFEENDADDDGLITEADMALLLSETREKVLSAFENGDDEWLQQNYGVYLTSAWYQAYKEFPPARETLPELSIPIYIFQGEMDLNTPAEGTREIEKTFQDLGKDNLYAQIFPGHDHDLNYILHVVDGTISDGLQSLFDVFSEIANGSL